MRLKFATHSIDFVEIMRWDSDSGQQENGYPKFEVIQRKTGNGQKFSGEFIDSSYVNTSIYYARVKQKNMITEKTIEDDLTVLTHREVWA